MRSRTISEQGRRQVEWWDLPSCVHASHGRALLQPSCLDRPGNRPFGPWAAAQTRPVIEAGAPPERLPRQVVEEWAARRSRPANPRRPSASAGGSTPTCRRSVSGAWRANLTPAPRTSTLHVDSGGGAARRSRMEG
jgi:hypothetical protein